MLFCDLQLYLYSIWNFQNKGCEKVHVYSCIYPCNHLEVTKLTPTPTPPPPKKKKKKVLQVMLRLTKKL